jgi:hypothetical protein
MGLFGGTCRWCGKWTWNKDKVGFVHPKCKIAELVDIESKKPKVLCPFDGTEMSKRLIEEKKVVINRCPTCNAVFLDPGVLEKLVIIKRGNDDDAKIAAAITAGVAANQILTK